MEADLAARIRDSLRFDEGERLAPYTDTRGNLTIGIGHNLTAKGITPAVSQLLFQGDLADVEAALDKFLPWWRGTADNAQAVLVNMAFNLGIGGLLAFHGFLHALQFRQYQTAAADLLNSRAAQQLPNRYGRLAALLRSAK